MSIHLEDDETTTPNEEEDRVLSWRCEALERAGFDRMLAVSLALAREVDLHSALDLVRRGCPPPLAASILL